MKMTKYEFELLLQAAIIDYSQCTEDDEKNDVINALIEALEGEK